MSPRRGRPEYRLVMPNKRLDAVEAGLRRLTASLEAEAKEIKKARSMKAEFNKVMKVLDAKLAMGRK